VSVKHESATGGPVPGRDEFHRGDVLVWLEQDEWYVVTQESPNWPLVACIASRHPARVGKTYGTSQGLKRIEEAEVPNKVWAQLALWRLTQ
jgi:hypothetical protein